MSDDSWDYHGSVAPMAGTDYYKSESRYDPFSASQSGAVGAGDRGYNGASAGRDFNQIRHEEGSSSWMTGTYDRSSAMHERRDAYIRQHSGTSSSSSSSSSSSAVETTYSSGSAVASNYPVPIVSEYIPPMDQINILKSRISEGDKEVTEHVDKWFEGKRAIFDKATEMYKCGALTQERYDACKESLYKDAILYAKLNEGRKKGNGRS